MPSLSTQKDFRRCRKISFCYLCGKLLTCEDTTAEHVFAKNMFREVDRQPAFILPAHLECNCTKSTDDEIFAQLLWAGRGRYPSARNQKVKPFFVQLADKHDKVCSMREDTTTQVWSWIQGCHAALYQTCLPKHTSPKSLITPFPGAIEADGLLHVRPITQQHRIFVDLIKRNRYVGGLDSIVANNDRVRYECVWIQFEDRRWGCVFALTVDGWEGLGRHDIAPRRGCAGFYVPESGLPNNARRESRLVFEFPNEDPLDAFGP